MVNDSSLQGGAVQLAFDLDSHAGVTCLLASVRTSDVSAEKKNELRDLVFLYTNGGRDQSVRNTLEQKIHAYGLVPVASAVKPASPENPIPPQTKYPFGTSRPSPSFTVPINNTVPKPSASTPSPKIVAGPEVKHDVPSVPVAPLEKVTPVPVVESTPVRAPILETNPIVPLSTAPENIPIQQQAAPYDSSQSLQRIREIKSSVNEKVGNPVNLVDIDNEVGREYMGALLDAMKKLNNGSSAVSAMKRLEEAYLKVEKTLVEHDSHKEEVKHSAPSPMPQQPVSEPFVPPRPEQKVEMSVPVKELSEIDSVGNNSYVVATKPLEVPRMPVQSQPVSVNPFPTIKPEAEPRSVWGSDTSVARVKKPKTPVVPSGHTISSLAQSKTKLHTPSDLPRSSDIETSSLSGDPLFTNEVNEGLQQLLSEWTLFRKSGLFGTGPNGREHPLFLKVSGLQIPLLLAGRFEGATQEVKQSITDYMNGWRYEQGIIYVPGETFEHYLRRVIRHILDLQKKTVIR